MEARTPRNTPRLARRARAARLAALVALATAACGDLLEVSDPDIVRPENLDTPAGLETRRAGAFGDFVKAFGGDPSVPSNDGGDGYILASGLLTDELKKTGTDPTRIEIDARRVQPTNTRISTHIYAPLQRARQAAETTADAYRRTAPAGPATDRAVAEMLNLAGYTYVLLGEGFCSGVPISRVTETGDIEYGEPLTTQQLLERAIERFDEAITTAGRAQSADLESLGRVGKGRALLDLGQSAEAAAAVSRVPTAFRYEIKHSTNTRRQENMVYFGVNQLERWSAVNREGGTGVDYLDAYSQGDPRTPWVLAPDGLGFDQSAGPQYYQLIYPARNSPIPLATGIEARLIEAEAALRAGATADFQRIHNELRASLRAARVAPIAADTMSADQRIRFHFRERALWLWLTGHRLGDLRRLIRQYGRTQDQVFPSGPYFRPQFPTYGSDVNFPVPVTETNNPRFRQCLDRNA